MPTGIGRRGVGGRSAALRQIATRFAKPPPRFIGFGEYLSAGTYVVSPGKAGLLHVFALGAGAGGASGGNQAGGGGAAAYRAIRVNASSQVSVMVGSGGAAGTDGGDTVITVDSQTLTCSGGKASGVGGIARGPWDIARNGGNGGNNSAGDSPTNGGTGGAQAGTFGGGGGSAGFSEYALPNSQGGNGNPFATLLGNGGAGSNGGAATAGSNYGGGGGAGATGGAGAPGGAYLFFVQDT